MEKTNKKVNAAIIVIGNEILSGRTQDANVVHLSKWLNEQPESISDGIYKNNTNAKWAARIVDLYKADHNLQTKQKTSPNAAEAVTRTKRGSIATDDGKRIWSVSEIAKLKPQQFAQYEKEIDQARKEGRIEQA